MKERSFFRPSPLFIFLMLIASAFSQDMSPLLYDTGNPAFTDIWVDPEHGNNSNSGNSSTLALRTLNEAWNRIPQKSVPASSGFRIRLMKGNYPEDAVPSYWESRYGSKTCPILIMPADPNEPVRLPATNLFDCPQEALKTNQCQYLYIENSDLSGAWGNAVDFVAVQYGHVVLNKIHRALDWCMLVKGGSACLRIEANEIYDAGTGGFTAGQGTGFEYMVPPWLHYEAYDIKFVNNVVHDTDGAGMGVNGGYNILLAYNTLYKVGTRSHAIEATFGLRRCGGNTDRCRDYLSRGGWGTTAADIEEPIPNRNVLICNNLVYNPEGFGSAWSHFSVPGPRTPSSGTHIPSPARSDDNLVIRGNCIWKGPSDLPLGVEEGDQNCQPNNPTCNADQIRQENTINQFLPELADPEAGDFKPKAGGSVDRMQSPPISDFAGGDRPASPAVPEGNLNNLVFRDMTGNTRAAGGPPGAFSSAGEKASHCYYVSTSGNDADSGSLEKPWATPGYASRRLEPGDTLIIRGGRYRLSRFDDDILIPKSGTAGKWITIKGETGNRPVLAGADNLFAAVILGGKSYIRLENLEITHDPAAAGSSAYFRDGIHIIDETPSTHIILIDLYIHHIDEFGLDVQDADSMEITGCRIEYCGFGAVGGPAAVHGGGKHVRIENCRFSYSGHYYRGGGGSNRPYDRPDGFGIEPSEGPVDIMNTVSEHNRGDGLDSKASNTSIRQCVVANNSCDGVKLWGGGSTVENTLVYGRGDGNPTHTTWAAIVIGTEQANSDFTITNVTVDDSLGNNYLMYVQYDETQTPIRLTIRNSIFRGSGPNCPIFVRDVVQLTCENNLFFMPNHDPLFIHGNTDYHSSNIGSLGKSNLYDDPKFVRPAWGTDGDYHLKQGSPALDSGGSANAPKTDLEGRARPQGKGVDMGCYETVVSSASNRNAGSPDAGFYLGQNNPNPFNSTTTIQFSAEEPCRVVLDVFDLLGKKVKTLVDRNYAPGKYTVSFDASDLSSGIYFYMIRMGNFKAMRKMVVME